PDNHSIAAISSLESELAALAYTDSGPCPSEINVMASTSSRAAHSFSVKYCVSRPAGRTLIRSLDSPLTCASLVFNRTQHAHWLSWDARNRRRWQNPSSIPAALAACDASLSKLLTAWYSSGLAFPRLTRSDIGETPIL